MKNTLTFIFIITTYFIQGQTDIENQHKYWKYREMLKSKFVLIGDEPGASIPMSCRIPGYAYGGTLDPNGTQLQWKDATITLGYYLLVLATECMLTNDLVLDGDLDEEYSNILSLQKTQCSIEPYYSIHELSMMNLTALFFRSNA